MGKNKMENFIFTVICCSLMVLGMSSYNSLLENGFGKMFLLGIFKTYVPVFMIALAADWFFIGPIVKLIVGKFVNKNTSFIRKILLISVFMVIGMCSLMSFISVLFTAKGDYNLFSMFFKALGRNFIFALPLQLLIVGPIARPVFFKFVSAKSV